MSAQPTESRFRLSHKFYKRLLIALLILLLAVVGIVAVYYLTAQSNHLTNPSPSPSPLSSSSPPTTPFVVPEYGAGALLALFACFAAFALFKTRGKHAGKTAPTPPLQNLNH